MKKDEVGKGRTCLIKKDEVGKGRTCLLEERDGGEKDGEEVDTGHHLDGAHAVGAEQFSLPVGRERVKGEVACEDDRARQGRHPGGAPGGAPTREQEEKEAEGGEAGGAVLPPRVGEV